MFEESDVQQLRSFLKREAAISFSFDSMSMKTKRGLQHLLCLKSKDQKCQKLYEIFLAHALQVEKFLPGGYQLFLKKFIEGDQTQVSNEKIRTKQQLLSALEKRIVDKDIYCLLTEALKYATCETHFSIKKSISGTAFLEVCEDYNFNCKYLLYEKNLISCKGAKILCIDGFIENVGEIHHVLEYLSETRQACVILSRGMSNDVLNTLSVNNERKTLAVYPYAVPFDVDNVNTLVDIAVVSNNDVVSSLKGNLISTVKMNEVNAVENCILDKDTLKIRNKISKIRVSQHVDVLKKMILERQELSDILSKRIKSLSSSCVDIHIPDDINYVSKSQQLDEGIRLISAVVSNSWSIDESLNRVYSSFQSTLSSLVNTHLL